MSDASATNVDAQLRQAVDQWLLWDGCDVTRDRVKQLVATADWLQLKQLFSRRLQFGTAGLRARVDAGTACINELVVVQTSQGLARYILEQHAADASPPGVVVGFDGRHESRRFAELTAAAFVRAGLRVYLYSRLCPTPWVAFGVRHLSAVAGVMVTASHNPRTDNGYKVYWDNGAQILPPHDVNIQQAILQCLEPHKDAWNTGPALAQTADPLDEVSAVYLSNLKAQCLPMSCPMTSVKFTLTAMHGVAHEFVKAAFAETGLPPFVPVTEQMQPDGDFPTVAFPNPEEGRSALQLSFATAEKSGCHVILANDPDADRLGVAERREGAPSSGSDAAARWRVFNGNEIGALLGWWCWHVHQQRHKTSAADKCHMIASTVSSKLLRAMAEREGFQFHETLTGFKWMANLADRLEKDADNKVLFAFEEAIGFMCGTSVLDKDGVSAAVQVALMALYLRDVHDRSLAQQLDFIYSRYGYHVSNNSYVICHQPDVVLRIFTRLRNWPQEKPCLTAINGSRYPGELRVTAGDGSCRVIRAVSVRDLTSGHDTARSDGLAELPVQEGSQMITWSLEGGCVITLRTSGTEPKIKWYAEMRCPPSNTAAAGDREQLGELLGQLLDVMQLEWLQTQLNQLQPRADA